MQETSLKFRTTKQRFFILFFIFFFHISLYAVQVQIGQVYSMEVSAPQGWIDATIWSCSESNSVYLERVGNSMCNAYPTRYFEGNAIITCDIYYSYQTYYNGRTHTRTGSTSRTFYISCVVPTLRISPDEVTVKPGEKVRLQAITTPTSSTEYPIVFWNFSDNNIASLEAESIRSYNGYSDIYINTWKAGVCVVTADIGGGITATCNVTVKNVEPDNVSLPSTAKTQVGETITLKPTLSPSDAETTYTWSSDNSSVASVSSSGVVSGKKTGTANITVETANGKTAICMVTVEKGNLSLTCNTESGLIAKGTRVKLTANRSDAEIYYTLDGSTPTASSTRYTNSIAINEKLTLKAIAMGSEYNSSSIVTRQYEVTGLVVNSYLPSKGATTRDFSVFPSITFNEEIQKSSLFDNISFSREGQTVQGDISINKNSVIFTPKDESGLVDGKYTFTIPKGAVKNNADEPNLATTNEFTINCPQLTLTADVNDGVVTAGTKVTLTCDVASAKIYYTKNEDFYSDISKDILYTEPITINEATTIYAMAVLDGYRDSKKLHKTYTISSLQVTESNMDNNHGIYGPDFVPCITFNSPIKMGKDFKLIRLKAGNVNGNSIILDNMLYFIPDNNLTPGNYTLFLPTEAVVTENGESNFREEYTFSIAYRNPVKSLAGTHNTSIQAGRYYSMYVNDLGELWTWGKNSNGQLGDGTTSDRKIPYMVMDNVSSVISSSKEFSNYPNHNLQNPSATFAIKKDGTLWGWGGNNNGQLGDNTTKDRLLPYKIMDNVASVQANDYRIFAIKKDRTLYGWGKNENGEIIAETTIDFTSPQKVMTDVKSIIPGWTMTYAIKNDKGLWVWGKDDGQLGTGTYNQGWQTFRNYNKAPYQILYSIDIAETATHNGYAIFSDGTLKAWGYNNNYMVGNNSDHLAEKPVDILYYVNEITPNRDGDQIFAIKTDHTLWAWGRSDEGQLGDGTSSASSYSYIKSPKKITNDVQKVIAHHNNFCMLKIDNTVWTWGLKNPANGYYGDGSATPVKILDGVIDISANGEHTLAIKKDGSVWIWGNSAEYYGVVDGIVPSMIFAPYTLSEDLTGICLPNDNISVIKGEKTYVAVDAIPTGAVCKSITYNSSNPSVATVSERGIVTAITSGTTTISVVADGKYTANCVIKVELPSGIINSSTSEEKQEPIYDVSGQRLTAPRKGINIVGGKKVILK